MAVVAVAVAAMVVVVVVVVVVAAVAAVVEAAAVAAMVVAVVAVVAAAGVAEAATAGKYHRDRRPKFGRRSPTFVFRGATFLRNRRHRAMFGIRMMKYLWTSVFATGIRPWRMTFDRFPPAPKPVIL